MKDEEDLTIPDFLRVENRAPASPDARKNIVKKHKAPGATPEPTQEEKILAKMSPKAQELVRERLRTGRMRWHWLLEPGTVESYESKVREAEVKKAERIALLKSLPKKEKPPKPKFGATVKFKILKEAPRTAGTAAAARYAEMVAWKKKHPDGTVDELLSQTKYGKNDYKWDITHGNIKSDV